MKLITAEELGYQLCGKTAKAMIKDIRNFQIQTLEAAGGIVDDIELEADDLEKINIPGYVDKYLQKAAAEIRALKPKEVDDGNSTKTT